jgi:hypothetical protein
MPLNSRQLADLVERAKLRPPSAVSQPQPSPTPPPKTLPLRSKGAAAAPTPPSPAPQSEHAAEAEDFPAGWQLSKDSWHFHRRFHAIFRRPMRHGEYSYLLHQIPNQAERLDKDCWRVTLPNSQRTLAVRATRWRLLAILPKDWQPPAPVTP